MSYTSGTHPIIAFVLARLQSRVRLGALVEHIVPIYRGANNINMLINILSIFRGQPPEGGGFCGFVANMLINI